MQAPNSMESKIPNTNVQNAQTPLASPFGSSDLDLRSFLGIWYWGFGISALPSSRFGKLMLALPPFEGRTERIAVRLLRWHESGPLRARVNLKIPRRRRF
jgi:hypothetical protein